MEIFIDISDYISFTEIFIINTGVLICVIIFIVSSFFKYLKDGNIQNFINKIKHPEGLPILFIGMLIGILLVYNVTFIVSILIILLKLLRGELLSEFSDYLLTKNEL